jgi:hypothetical protein
MGAGAQQRQGLWIKTLDVNILSTRKKKAKSKTYAKAKKKVKARTIYKVERFTEVWCVGLIWNPNLPGAIPADPVPATSAQAIRQFGLKVGMLFRNEHTVSSVEFAVGNTRPLPGAYRPVPRPAAETKAMEDGCKEVFGARVGKWYAFVFRREDFPALTYPPKDDRLYFRVVVDANFNHDLDCQVAPVMAVLGGLDVRQHYALGLGVFSRGLNINNSIQFDTAVVGSMTAP